MEILDSDEENDSDNVRPNIRSHETEDRFMCCCCNTVNNFVFGTDPDLNECPNCFHQLEGDCCQRYRSEVYERIADSTQLDEDQSDALSDNFSDVFSLPSISTSPTSVTGTTPIILEAIARFVDLIYGIIDLRSIVRTTGEGNIVETGRLQKIFRHLLKEFSRDLFLEYPSDEYWELCQFFRTSSRQLSLAIVTGLQQGPVNSSQTSQAPNRGGESLSDGDSTDADSEEPRERAKYNQSAAIRRLEVVVTSSHAFKTFLRNLGDELHHSFRYRIRRFAHSQLVKNATPKEKALMLEVVSELFYSDPPAIHVNKDSISWIDLGMNFLDSFTEEDWEWWPFATAKQPLTPGYARLEWECVRAHTVTTSNQV